MWNSTDERLRRAVWQCNNKYVIKGEKGCENKHIEEEMMNQVFVMRWNSLVSEKEKHKSRLKEIQRDDNLLIRFRAGHFLKMFEDIRMVKDVNVDHLLATLESIKVYEDGHLIIIFLEDLKFALM